MKRILDRYIFREIAVTWLGVTMILLMILLTNQFARVLGGGVVPGSIVLIGGDPGIGKSTLLLQVALEMSGASTVLYVSGEESPTQIRLRADLLEGGDSNCQVLS